MEIERLKNLYKSNSIEKFYNWLSKGDPIEVRFLSDKNGNKFHNYELIINIANDIQCDFRFTSLFLLNWKQMEKLLKYDNGNLRKNYNVFVGINPRRKIPMKSKRGIIYKGYYGGKAGVKSIRTVFCDIEHAERQGTATEIQLQECLDGANFLVTALGLEDFYINCSGNGVHLLFSLDTEIELPLPKHKELEDKLVYDNKDPEFYSLCKAYNRYIEQLNKLLNSFNNKLIVDEGAKDLSRIGRFPGFWNVKVGKTPRQVGTLAQKLGINKGITQNILTAKLQINKEKKDYVAVKIASKNHRYNSMTIMYCPLVKFLQSELLPSTLSRNHYLEQSLARILRDNDIKTEEIQGLINKMNEVQMKQVQVEPSYLTDDNPFGAEAVNSYCVGCKIDLIYPILEDIPEIEDGFIDEHHYQMLNSISEMTMHKMAIHTEVEAKYDYQYIKDLIRFFVNLYPRSEIFFTMKKMYKVHWDYLDRNRIVLSLLNKTRKQIQKG